MKRNFFGLLIGGWGGSTLYRRGRRYPSLLAGGSAILSCPPLWYLINRVDNHTSWPQLGFFSILAGIFSGATGPIVKATLQNVSLPTSRGQCFALLTTFDDFGRGLGPVFVAMLIKNMGGRIPAFNVGVSGWLFCGLFNLLVFFTVDRDESRVQAQLAASLKEEEPVNKTTEVT